MRNVDRPFIWVNRGDGEPEVYPLTPEGLLKAIERFLDCPRLMSILPAGESPDQQHRGIFIERRGRKKALTVALVGKVPRGRKRQRQVRTRRAPSRDF